MKLVDRLYDQQPEDLYFKLTCILGTSAVFCASAIGLFTLLVDDNFDNQDTKIDHVSDYSCEEVNSSSYKEFAKGEHIITEDITYIRERKSVFQLPYHEGYKLEGITGTKRNAIALYVNTEDVIAFPTGVGKTNEEVYDTFGVCVNRDKRDNNDDSMIFQPGEHILAIPIEKPGSSNHQFECPDGYYAEDVTYFGDNRFIDGAYIIYTNDTEVKCKKDEDGKCLEFGIPVEKAKVKKL